MIQDPAYTIDYEVKGDGGKIPRRTRKNNKDGECTFPEIACAHSVPKFQHKDECEEIERSEELRSQNGFVPRNGV